LWTLALLLALMLLMVDITVRRVVITIPEAVAALMGRLRLRRQRRAIAAPVAERLQAAKQRAAQRTHAPTAPRERAAAAAATVRAASPKPDTPPETPPPVATTPKPTSTDGAPNTDGDTLGRLLKAKRRGGS
jgi:hypothetical protein